MHMTKEVKELALHAVATLERKVEATDTQDENYAVLRNIQCSVEALMETLEPAPIQERAYCASYFGWKAGEWPEEKLLEDGTKILRTERKIINEGELEGVFYTSIDGKWLEIFND